VGLVVVGYYVRPYLSPTPAVVRPGSPADLDPAVNALVESKIATVEASPRDAGAHGDLGAAYEANGLWGEAFLCYTNAVDLDRGHLDWHIHKAITARQAGDFESALRTLGEQSPIHPSSAPLQHHYADALLESGELEEAERHFRRVVELSPGTVHGYVGLGDVLLQKDAPEKAVPVLEQAVALRPTYKQANYLLGTAYNRLGRTEEAEAALRIGLGARIEYLRDGLSDKIAAYTVNATGRNLRASQYLDAGRPDQAARILEDTYQYHNRNVDYVNTLGAAYLRLGKLDDAHRLLLRARKLDPDQFSTALNLYAWALRSGRREEALSFAEEAVNLASDRDDTHLARAQALTELGHFEEALASARTAVEIDARKASNHGLLAEIQFRMGDASEAEGSFERALSLDPNLLPALVGLARVKLLLGKNHDARQVVVRAQQIAPDHPRVVQIARELEATR
jgi:tetratricopeptide (TPR) repeat protein